MPCFVAIAPTSLFSLLVSPPDLTYVAVKSRTSLRYASSGLLLRDDDPLESEMLSERLFERLVELSDSEPHPAPPAATITASAIMLETPERLAKSTTRIRSTDDISFPPWHQPKTSSGAGWADSTQHRWTCNARLGREARSSSPRRPGGIAK